MKAVSINNLKTMMEGGVGQAGQGAGDHYLPPLPPRPQRHKQEEKNFCQNLVRSLISVILSLYLSYISINQKLGGDISIVSSKIFSVIHDNNSFSNIYLYPYLYTYLYPYLCIHIYI